MFSENGFSGSLDYACTARDTKWVVSVGSGQVDIHLIRTAVENIFILLMKHFGYCNESQRKSRRKLIICLQSWASVKSVHGAEGPYTELQDESQVVINCL